MKPNNFIRVPYGQAVHGKEEEEKVLSVLQEHRTIMGNEIKLFEDKVAKLFGKKYGIMVNSGSSANFLAIKLLKLPVGSEVITPVLTFATTVGPLVQNGLIPVFVDVTEGTYGIDVTQIEKLITKKTKALMIPWLIGNVIDIEKLRSIAKKYKLFFIEDSCDTFAATFNEKPTGAYTDITTTSFYGSHIITAGGNGGMIMVNSPQWRDKLKVLRGWGRSSSLFSESESIEKRFKTKLDSIPYDAKFIFSDIGYNFLPSEIGAAFGNAQLNKLNQFKKIREHNFKRYMKFFSKYSNLFILPKQDPRVRTQWLALAMTIKKGTPFTRFALVKFLEAHNIQTRPIFTGNILRQPAFKNIQKKISKNGYPIANAVMERGFLIGCHHGLSSAQLDHVENTFMNFFNSLSKK